MAPFKCNSFSKKIKSKKEVKVKDNFAPWFRANREFNFSPRERRQSNKINFDHATYLKILMRSLI